MRTVLISQTDVNDAWFTGRIRFAEDVIDSIQNIGVFVTGFNDHDIGIDRAAIQCVRRGGGRIAPDKGTGYVGSVSLRIVMIDHTKRIARSQILIDLSFGKFGSVIITAGMGAVDGLIPNT